MSGVILGIIGIILFVGLALAGANYLGPRVLSANASRDSGIVLNSIQQTAIGVQVFKAKRRLNLHSTTTAIQSLIDTGTMTVFPMNPFNRNAPVNPNVAGSWPYPLLANGRIGTSGRPGWIVMAMGASSKARDACIAIERANQHLDRLEATIMETPMTFAARAPAASGGGCVRNAGGWGGVPVGDYVAYTPA